MSHASTFLNSLYPFPFEPHSFLPGAFESDENPSEVSGFAETTGHEGGGSVVLLVRLGNEKRIALSVAEVVENGRPQTALFFDDLLEGLGLAPLLSKVSLFGDDHRVPAASYHRPVSAHAEILKDRSAVFLRRRRRRRRRRGIKVEFGVVVAVLIATMVMMTSPAVCDLGN